MEPNRALPEATACVPASMGPQAGLRGDAWKQDCLPYATLTAWCLQTAAADRPELPESAHQL